MQPTLLSDDTLWCGYFLTTAQKLELINQTMLQFNKPVNKRLRPYQLVDLVRHMVKM